MVRTSAARPREHGAQAARRSPTAPEVAISLFTAGGRPGGGDTNQARRLAAVTLDDVERRPPVVTLDADRPRDVDPPGSTPAAVVTLDGRRPGGATRTRPAPPWCAGPPRR